MKKALVLILLTLPLPLFAQFNLSLGGGYTLPSGEHHAAYESNLLLKTNYSNKKNFNYSASVKIAYALNNLSIGLGLERGNYQTKKETEISGISSFVPSSSFVAATGRYLTPHVFINYKATIVRRFTLQAGIMTGLLFTGFDKDNGILVTKTEALLGIVPPQTLGLEVHTGKVGRTNSSSLTAGAQLEVGYNLSNNFNLHLEVAARKSSVDARATIAGYEQPFNYNLWYCTGQIGLRYTLGKKVKRDQAAEQN